MLRMGKRSSADKSAAVAYKKALARYNNAASKYNRSASEYRATSKNLPASTDRMEDDMLTLVAAWPTGLVTSRIMPAWRSSLVAKKSASYSRPQRSPTQSSVQAFSQKWVHALRVNIMFELIFHSKNEKKKNVNLCKKLHWFLRPIKFAKIVKQFYSL